MQTPRALPLLVLVCAACAHGSPVRWPDKGDEFDFLAPYVAARSMGCHAGMPPRTLDGFTLTRETVIGGVPDGDEPRTWRLEACGQELTFQLHSTSVPWMVLDPGSSERLGLHFGAEEWPTPAVNDGFPFGRVLRTAWEARRWRRQGRLAHCENAQGFYRCRGSIRYVGPAAGASRWWDARFDVEDGGLHRIVDVVCTAQGAGCGAHVVADPGE